MFGIVAIKVKQAAHDRAQSESLGSILLVAVVVISASTFGVYYVASTTDGGTDGANGPDSFDFVVETTQDELRITHNGGPSVPTVDLQVIVENASGEYTFDNGTMRGGDGDDRFDPGEAWIVAWNQSVDADITVSLINVESETLLFRERLTISATATDRPGNLAQSE